jgi:hypothetical protein
MVLRRRRRAYGWKFGDVARLTHGQELMRFLGFPDELEACAPALINRKSASKD